MKGRNIGLIAIGAIILILVFVGCGSYNKLVELDENVTASWADVQGTYQRRNDLIPNLVNTVRSEATFEQQTLIQTIEARYKNIGNVKIDPANLNNETFQQFQQAQGQLSSALQRLMVIVENYPTLRANDAFRGLMAELAGSENRINKARSDFNETVRVYNIKVRSFPVNLVSGMMGFKKRDSFEASAEAQDAPKVPENLMDTAR
jgi:LemA protein